MKFILVILFSFVGITVYSQNLDDQFKAMNESSQTFKDYKVIKINALNTFWEIVSDSIKSNNLLIKEIAAENKRQEEDISILKETLAKNEIGMKEMEYETNHIDLFGVSLSKTAYKALFFTVTSVLILACTLLFLNLNEKRKTALVKVNAFETLESKFENYKRSALEKQMKLRRELQTERNKLEQIRST